MARKGENIYRRKDGRWEGRYIADRTGDGKAVYRSVYAKTYTQAKQKLQEAKETSQKAIEKKYLPDSEKEFSEFLYRWLEYIRPRIKESSYVKYANLIELHIDKEIGVIKLGNLNTAVIDEFVNTLLEETEEMAPLSAKTVTDILGVVRNVIRYVNGRYQRIDCDFSQITIKKEETRMRILSREEQEQLIRYLRQYPSPMNCGIFLTLFTGLRIGDDDDKIRLNQRKPSKYKGLRRFGPEKNLQRINKFMKERPIFYKNLIQMKENIRFYLRCFYCITKVMILQFNSENRTELARNG